MSPEDSKEPQSDQVEAAAQTPPGADTPPDVDVESAPGLRLGRSVLIAFLIIGAAGACYLGLGMWRGRNEGASGEALKEMGALIVMSSVGDYFSILEGDFSAISGDKHVFSANLSLPKVRGRLDEALHFVPDLVYLEVIDLSRTTISDEQLASLAGLGRLTSITLNYTEIGDAGVAHLSGLGDLTALYLRETNVSAKGLNVIGRLPSLKILNLSKTKVEGDLAGLSKATNLNWLLMEGMEVSDAAIDTLAKLPILRRFTVIDGQVSEEAIARLRKAKPDITIDQ